AWRTGAGLDAWFESAERTHAAWSAAIEDAGLGGRYRALEMGEWAAAEALDPADLEAFCRQSLPWDHIDSGVDKAWLAEDLRRALAAAVVPDCSFDGCSHCGVCGPELGHNVVVPPPSVPARLPPRAPVSSREQWLRFGFAKRGSLALISHLDSLRLLERALRRSGLPVSFTGGFHPLPRLQVALPLPLGAEGHGEWFDLEFHALVAPEEARRRLQEALPPEFELLSVAPVAVAAPSLSQELREAHWRLELRPVRSPGPDGAAWREACAALLAAASLPWHDTDKKGRPRERDCRPYLLALALVGEPEAARGGAVSLDLRAAIDPQGRSLRPEFLRQWLADRLATPLVLGQIERRALLLAAC
ncbi:MAG: TIGR03936 family radical SAM-associated protein, partial [Cyanobium sp.]